jgi:hypothetical protein
MARRPGFDTRQKGFFSTPHSSDRLWGPSSLLSNVYGQLFTRDKSGRGVKLITHLHLVLR